MLGNGVQSIQIEVGDPVPFLFVEAVYCVEVSEAKPLSEEFPYSSRIIPV